MGSSPRDFRVFHHLRDGVVAEETVVVPASERAEGWMMGGKGRVGSSPTNGESGNGEIPAFGCVTLDHGGVVSDRVETGAAAASLTGCDSFGFR